MKNLETLRKISQLNVTHICICSMKTVLTKLYNSSIHHNFAPLIHSILLNLSFDVLTNKSNSVKGGKELIPKIYKLLLHLEITYYNKIPI